MEEEEISLTYYTRILWKRKWIPIVILFITLLAVLILNSLTTPVYKATTKILISPSGTQQTIFGSVRNNPIFGGANEIENQIEILKSYDIAKSVAMKMPLDIFENSNLEMNENKVFNWLTKIAGSIYSTMKNIISSFIDSDDNDKNHSLIESSLENNIKQIRDSITVDTLKNTSMIEISFESNNPEVAAKIANTIADVFVDKSLIINRTKASEVKKFIEAQLIEKEKELAEEEEEKMQYERSLEDFPDKELRLARLERSVRVSENIYLILLEKYQESRINEVMEFGNITIIDKAMPPGGTIKPKKMLNLAVGGILGLMLGVVLVFFMEYMDNTIKNSEDVERILNLPILGVIPKDNFEKRNKFKKMAFK